MRITKKTKIGEILEKNPEKAALLMNAGMGCVGCPMAQMETIEEGCSAHGISEKDIDNLVEELNK
jgi:hydroxylamine reductase